MVPGIKHGLRPCPATLLFLASSKYQQASRSLKPQLRRTNAQQGVLSILRACVPVNSIRMLQTNSIVFAEPHFQ
jgi:hypothetical protein